MAIPLPQLSLLSSRRQPELGQNGVTIPAGSGGCSGVLVCPDSIVGEVPEPKTINQPGNISVQHRVSTPWDLTDHRVRITPQPFGLPPAPCGPGDPPARLPNLPRIDARGNRKTAGVSNPTDDNSTPGSPPSTSDASSTSAPTTPPQPAISAKRSPARRSGPSEHQEHISARRPRSTHSTNTQQPPSCSTQTFRSTSLCGIAAEDPFPTGHQSWAGQTATAAHSGPDRWRT